jgi:hypothetical protein
MNEPKTPTPVSSMRLLGIVADYQFPVGGDTARLTIIGDVGKKRPTTHDIDAIIELLQIARKSLARAEECRDQGAGYWDCAKLDKCVNPQCDDCPQKMPNVRS